MREKVLAWLTTNVPTARIEHILRVEQMAVDLASAHYVDVDKAATAGLMHDLAKYFKHQQLLQMAEAGGVKIDEIMEINPHLLHADVGAIVARETFGIADPEILEAIANHTLGQPGMSPLSCIIFLADSLEPGRGDTPELVMMRQIAPQNLPQAVALTCNYTLKSLVDTPSLIYPRVVYTRNWFLQKWKSKPTIVKSAP
jgi:predicted HD superfamily hydrolase involved in NAD metabolism